MANKKITQLTELTTPQNDDVLPIVDVANTTTKKVKWSTIISTITGLFVPVSRTINTKQLITDIVLTPADIGSPAGSGSSTGTNTGDETQASIISKLTYTPENVANKTTTIDGSSTHTQYASAKASWDNLRLKSAGCIVHPSLTDNGGGSVTIADATVSLYNNAFFEGVPLEYDITGLTQTLTDQTLNYVVANYNSGTPIMQIITDVDLITESDITPIYTIVRTGSIIHVLDWDELGLGLSNKIHQSIVKTQRYRRQSGFIISGTGTRNVAVTSGIMYVGANRVPVMAMDTSTGDTFTRYAHVAGVWTATTGLTQYNNSQYDNGTNLVALTAGRYAVNWVYRGVEDQKHIYMTLGTGDYTLVQAQEAQPPVPPTVVSGHAVLVGKIIIQSGAGSPTSVQSAFDTTFSTAAVTAHADLTGLQGGTAGEYYHLTAAYFAIATQAATSILDGYLTAADWSTFNAKQAALVSGINIKTVNGVSLLGSGDVGTIDVAHGGTGATTAANARTALGLAIGSDVQAYNANLTTWQGKTAPSGTVLGTTDAQTVTNKRIQSRVSSAASTSTLTADVSAYNSFYLTAQAAALTIAAPTGTPVQGEVISIKVKDNGTARAISWDPSFTAIGAALPTTTTLGKWLVVTAEYTGSTWLTVFANGV